MSPEWQSLPWKPASGMEGTCTQATRFYDLFIWETYRTHMWADTSVSYSQGVAKTPHHSYRYLFSLAKDTDDTGSCVTCPRPQSQQVHSQSGSLAGRAGLLTLCSAPSSQRFVAFCNVPRFSQPNLKWSYLLLTARRWSISMASGEAGGIYAQLTLSSDLLRNVYPWRHASGCHQFCPRPLHSCLWFFVPDSILSSWNTSLFSLYLPIKLASIWKL